MESVGFFFAGPDASRSKSQSSSSSIKTPSKFRIRPKAHRTTSSVSTTASASSASSVGSPTQLITPQHATIAFAETRRYAPPPKLDFSSPSGFRDEDDDLGEKLVRVLSLTPRPPFSSFSPPLQSSRPDENVRPDDSPLLPPTDWALPAIPSYALDMHYSRRNSASFDSLQALKVASTARSRAGSMTSGSTVNVFLQSTSMPVKDGREGEKSGSSHRAHRSTPSDSSSIISSASSGRSNGSLPPIIPGRTSSRKRPALSGRGSGLKLSAFLPTTASAITAPAVSTPPRRPSNVSVISANSVLDPYPALPSASSSSFRPLSPRPARSCRPTRATSFSSPLSPIAASPRYIPSHAHSFTSDLCLRRTSSAPNIRSWRNSTMPRSGQPTTPKYRPSHSPKIDFTASPDSPFSSARPRPSLFPFDFFASPKTKPSPEAIEHIAEPRLYPRKDLDMVIPLYETPLSPHAHVRLRPAPRPNRRAGKAEDVYTECKKADRMRGLIDLAGVDEASEAIREAESWIWARPPPRNGRLVQFVEAAGERNSARGRRTSGMSHSSQGSTSSRSDMGISTSFSVDTISEEAVITPSSSDVFLAIPVSAQADPTTPTMSAASLPLDITPKATRAGESVSILRTTSSQYGLGFEAKIAPPIPASVAAPRLINKKSLGNIKAKSTSGWRGSLRAKEGEKKKEKGSSWFAFQDIGSMGTML